MCKPDAILTWEPKQLTQTCEEVLANFVNSAKKKDTCTLMLRLKLNKNYRGIWQSVLRRVESMSHHAGLQTCKLSLMLVNGERWCIGWSKIILYVTGLSPSFFLRVVGNLLIHWSIKCKTYAFSSKWCGGCTLLYNWESMYLLGKACSVLVGRIGHLHSGGIRD